MKAKPIKHREQFEREAGELLRSLGAVQDKEREPWPCYFLNTPAGELRLSIHTDLWICDKPWFQGGGFPWVAGRFEDVKAARELTHGESNPYSGKWNHHYWHGWKESFTRGLLLLEHALRSVTEA
jgi:hypothetical protein